MDIFNDNGAEFSEDRMYRYLLWRKWDSDKPKIMFIGLNPSTANETSNDATIRRVIKFAQDWGYGGVYMCNLFAFVTPYPKELAKADDPIGDNDEWLLNTSKKVDKVIFAWGSFKEAKDRAKYVSTLFNGFALVINADGTPRHPLYVTADTIPIPYE